MRLSRGRHLVTRVEGVASEGVGAAELLNGLHPTPAVGGYPTEDAMVAISKLETFDRGWYAAPVGWIAADAAEFAVAIRSGLVEGKKVSLYSGAGIVGGSTADGEWSEIEDKIEDFISVFGTNGTTAT
jgi:menaquinone-specific isochorismate synthase